MKEEVQMSKKYTYEDFLDIIERLRAEDGCPWDREQTHESLRPCMMEEAAELLSSIRIYGKTGNAENMQEELGDIFLQVVMHSQIAREEGLFTIEDVIQTVSEKMVRRHPHVFGEVEADSAGQVLENWDEIKKKEKEGKTWIESPLKEIPVELPALTRGPKILKKAQKLYGYESSIEEDLAKLHKGVKEIEQTLGFSMEQEKNKALEKSVGDILLALSDIARRYRIPMEQVLTDRIEDIIEQCE